MNEKSNKAAPEISIVIPLYNEEEVFPSLISRLTALMDSSLHSIDVVLVNDGSSDNTPDLMQKLSLEDGRFVSVMLSRNFGHQLALSAGLAHVSGTQAVMILDGDLQDPPELLDEFFAKYKEGYEIIYAIRTKRKESFLKKLAYRTFYRTLKRFANTNIPLDSGDFGMLSRRVVDIINEMPEESRFVRGMRSWVGFKQTGIVYERDSRAMGEVKYSWGKLMSLAFNGLFNFSEVPIRLISRIGLITIIVALIFFAYVFVKRMFYDVPEGYTSLLLAIILFSGVQLLSIGVLGEYILRIFFQVKRRPLFIVDKVIRQNAEEDEAQEDEQ